MTDDSEHVRVTRTPLKDTNPAIGTHEKVVVTRTPFNDIEWKELLNKNVPNSGGKPQEEKMIEMNIDAEYDAVLRELSQDVPACFREQAKLVAY